MAEPNGPIRDELEPAMDDAALERVWRRLDAPPAPARGVSGWIAAAAAAALVLLLVGAWQAMAPAPQPARPATTAPSPRVDEPPNERPSVAPPARPAPMPAAGVERAQPPAPTPIDSSAPARRQPPRPAPTARPNRPLDGPMDVPLDTPRPAPVPAVDPITVALAAAPTDLDAAARSLLATVRDPAAPGDADLDGVLALSATLREDRGAPQVSAAVLEAALSDGLPPTAPIYVALSDAWAAAGEPERAARAARRALRASPDGPDADRMRRRAVPRNAPR